MDNTQENAIVGKLIKQGRKRLKFSQRELALELSVRPERISLWENGKVPPDAVVLVKIANLLGKKLEFK